MSPKPRRAHARLTLDLIVLGKQSMAKRRKVIFMVAAMLGVPRIAQLPKESRP